MERNKYGRRYSDEELFQILRDKEKELGRPPYKREVSQCGAICYRFGSWKRALEKAGIDLTRKPKKTIYSDEELISILINSAKKFGRPPKYYEVQQATTMAFRFGSWNKALAAAGLKAYYRKKKTTHKRMARRSLYCILPVIRFMLSLKA